MYLPKRDRDKETHISLKLTFTSYVIKIKKMRIWCCAPNFSIPPKRIIIRQGHFAENFYFILSGHGKLLTNSVSIATNNSTYKLVFTSDIEYKLLRKLT